MRAWIGSIAVAIAAVIAALSPAAASTGTVKVQWYSQAVVKLALTPNYASGCGTVKAVFGTQPTPAAPPQGCMMGGAIDFGGILAGTNYLYKFASHVNIQSNDVNGFSVYGEGAADFVNTADGFTTPLNQALYYLTSTSGGTDTNTGFSASFPFYRTSGTATPPNFTTAPTITYASYPPPIASTNTAGSADYYYDYQLKVPAVATNGQYYVWVVYTVVPK